MTIFSLSVAFQFFVSLKSRKFLIFMKSHLKNLFLYKILKTFYSSRNFINLACIYRAVMNSVYFHLLVSYLILNRMFEVEKYHLDNLT